MRVIDKLASLEKRLQTLAPRRRVDLEPIELRAQVLDDIEARIEPLGDGRLRLPYNCIRLRILEPDVHRRAALEALFGRASGFRDAVLQRLRDARATADDDFEVSAKVTSATRTPGEAPYKIEFLHRKVKAAPPAPARAQLVVTKGTASQKVYACDEPRINIGRVEEVLDAAHHVVRRNHVAFTGEQDATNETVSRTHAHIKYSTATREFRVHDDHSSYGTRIFRNGRTIQVPASRGALLQSGDEISFGRAAVRFVVKSGRGT